jgi:O-antigen/teichoic acid export membrane protein
MNAIRQALSRVNVKEFLWSLVSRLASPVLSFSVLLMASRMLSIEEYGLYNFLFSVGSSLGLVLVLGQNVLLLKHYRNTGKPEDAPGNAALLRMNAVWLACGALFLAAATALIYPFRQGLELHYQALHVAFVFAAVFSVSEYMQYYFRVKGNVGLALTPRENIWRILTLLCFPFFTWTGFMNSGARAMEITTVLLVLVVGYQVLRMLALEGRGFLRQTHMAGGSSQKREWTHESLFFTANSFFVSASLYLETILIGIFLSLEAAAFYFVAFRLAALLMLPVTIIDTVGVPMVSAKLQERNTAGAQYLISILSAASFAGTLLAYVFMMLIGKFALGLFEPSFAEHFDVLVILCLLPVLHAFFGPGSSLLMIGGGERYFLAMRSVAFAFYIGALALAAPVYGMAGIAAIGTLHSVAVLYLCRNWSLKHMGVDNMASTIVTVLRNWRQGNVASATPGHKDGQ